MNKLDNYVVDVLFDKGDKSVTIPSLARKLQKWGITTIDLEVSKTSRSYAEELSKELDRIGYHCAVTTHTAPQNNSKEMRIYDAAPDIRTYFIFRDTSKRAKEYNQFMQNVFSFTVEGKNRNDDAPDVLAMGCKRLFVRSGAGVEIMQRPF